MHVTDKPHIGELAGTVKVVDKITGLFTPPPGTLYILKRSHGVRVTNDGLDWKLAKLLALAAPRLGAGSTCHLHCLACTKIA